MSLDDAGWVPDTCTLPTAQQPFRLAEFDGLFATLFDQQRLSPTRLRWQLDPHAESTARHLAARESSCCSFFRFSFTVTDDRLHLDVEVPPAPVDVLNAIAARAATHRT